MADSGSAGESARGADTDELVDALAQTAHVGIAILGRIAGEYDLSLTQLRVLAILRDRRLRMSELAAHLGLEKSTLSGLVQRAEQRGLVQRAPDPDDRRSIEVFLGPAAAELAQPLSADVDAGFAPMIARLDTDERVELRRLLDKLLGSGARGAA